MSIFYYTKQEIESLSLRDKTLGGYIAKAGRISRETNSDVFAGLISSIVSQQISTKAAATVTARLLSLCGGKLAPEALAGLGAEAVKNCGMTMKKAGYILGAAEAALSGAVDFGSFHEKPDAEVICQLVSLPGVGVWTAEMLLIFSLNRPDVLSWNDLGIRRGITRLYGLERLDKSFFNELRERYSPYASVASLYLWDAAK